MTQQPAAPTILMPQINLVDEIDSALPLEHTDISVQITGPAASVVVSQRFGNPLKELAELDYLFPLPEGAAITGFELTIGQRRIVGDLQAVEAAREAYDAARQAGQRAGLFEQRRPNLFALRLANVHPGETIQARMRYQQRLKFEDDGYEFVFPMGITPKYDNPQYPEEGKVVHAPIAKGGEAIGPVEIQVAIDAGVEVTDDPTSPSHPLEVVRIDERRFQVRLGGEHIPDHDFVLRYGVCSERTRAAAWMSETEDKITFLATFLPERLDDETPVQPREFVFVLDRSGSMSGQPIEQARNALRACLRTLNPEDTFRILLFDDKLEWYRQEPVRLTQHELEQADAYLAKVQGRGGTDIVGAIVAALQLAPDPARLRFVVFLTDGAVSAEERTLEQMRSQLGAARLYTFGIGPSVNRALLSSMARIGRGRAAFLQLNEDIEGAIIRFQDSVSFPMLTDLIMEWENAKAWDVYPARLPDLYAGQAVEVCGRLAKSASDAARLTVRGKRAGQEVRFSLTLNGAGGQDRAVERIWAQARVEALAEQMAMEPGRADKLRAELVGVALEYDLVTAYTAFVAVDAAGDIQEGKAKVIHVAQPLPQGLYPEAFQPGRMMMQAGMMPAAPVAVLPASFAPQTRAERGGGLLRKVASMLGADRSDEAQPTRQMATFGSALPPASEEVALGGGLDTPEGELRHLARTQNVEGSWNGDVEKTAAAVLAFVRAGHTTRGGSYRQVLRKAARWLNEAQVSGFAAFVRARALQELANTTGDAKETAAAQASLAALPKASTPLEVAAFKGEGSAPEKIVSLDDLRMASLLNAKRPVPADIFRGAQADLARTWAATILV